MKRNKTMIYCLCGGGYFFLLISEKHSRVACFAHNLRYKMFSNIKLFFITFCTIRLPRSDNIKCLSFPIKGMYTYEYSSLNLLYNYLPHQQYSLIRFYDLVFTTYNFIFVTYRYNEIEYIIRTVLF